MPITSESSTEAQCRLCASSAKGDIIEIFGEDGKTRNLAKKIEECLPISVSRGDCFPKSICLICLEKLEQFNNFREDCIKSERSFEATWSNVHPDQNIEFSLEPECCLQEVEQEEPENNALLFQKPVVSPAKEQHQEQRSNGLFQPENIPLPKKSHRGLADFIITPIMAIPKVNKPLGSTHDSKLRLSLKPHASPRYNFPQIGVLNPDDYILMYEEHLPDSTSGLPEYRDGREEEEERRKNQVLPPMWDVYEKITDGGEAKFLHRRYIINKQSFPCSLCGACFMVNQGCKRLANTAACYENDINYLNNLPLGRRNPPNLLEIRPLPAKHKTALVLGKKRAPPSEPARPFISTPVAPRPTLPAVTLSPVTRSPGQTVVNTKHQFVSHMIKREPSEEAGASVTSHDPQSFNDLVIKNFYCEICNQYFPRRSSLKRHQRSHLLDKMYPCTRCDKIFTRNEHLSRHLLLHTQARPFQCQVCMKKYTRKEHVDRHILIHPQIPEAEFRSRRLEQAGMEISSVAHTPDSPMQTLQQKIQQICHSKVDIVPRMSLLHSHRSYVCELCGHGFARKEHLQRHKRRMHTVMTGKPGARDEAKPYSCPTCGKTFTRKEHLVRHNKIHLRESLLGLLSPGQALEERRAPQPQPEPLNLSPVKSEPQEAQSLLSLSGADGLDVSLSVVPANSSRADVAPPPPTNKLDISISLVDDSLSQSASSSDNLISFLKPFTCTFCVDKRFTRKSHLVRHFKRIHPTEDLASLGITAETSRSEKVSFNADTFVSNEEEHLCKLCNKHFSRRYHLNRHLKLHVAMKTGKIREKIDEEDKPFQCSSCRGRFHQYEGFQNHRCTGTEVGSMVLVGSVQRRSSADQVATRRRRSRNGLECERCGDSFATRKQLAKHKLTHRPN